MSESDTLRKVEMPLLGRAMGYAAGLKTCHDCFADRAAIVLYDAIIAARAEIADKESQYIEVMEGAYSKINKLDDKIKAVTEQRDRLAEALNRIANNNVQDLPETDYAYELGRMEGIAKIALQSLTTNTPDQERKSPASGGSQNDPHRHCYGGGGNNIHCGCKYNG
jgi:hypothetical protein